MKICLVAGEPSGDFLGASLVSAIKLSRPECSFSGVGGPLMKTAGLASLFPYEDLSVMGILEVLPKIPVLLSRIRQTVEHIKVVQPDIVVTIDSPDFCFRVAKAVKKQMKNPPKIIHYVAPTVWAWREGRAEKISRFLDGLICLFDFEPPYFKKYGLRSIAVGHPLVEGDALKADGSSFREDAGVGERETVVGILFGSRKGELNRTGPVLYEALTIMSQRMERLPHVVAPTLPHLRADVLDLLKDYQGPVHVVTDPAQKWNAFKSFDVAMAVSGTVGLELAALQVPHVIAYKIGFLTHWIVKSLIKVKFAHLANIMMNREIVPEFIQEKCQAGLIADRTFELLTDPSVQKQELAAISHKIGAGQEIPPSGKAASFVLSFL